MNEKILCPLCGYKETETVRGPLSRSYSKCLNCGIVYVPPEFFPSAEESRKRYLQHKNTPESSGYVGFLRKALDPVFPYMKKGFKALDFGCGHQPVLAGILENLGLGCDYYDPLFFPEGIKSLSYDIIFSTETFEHFQEPAAEISYIFSLIRPGGYLSVMTRLIPSDRDFYDWFYPRDPTHIVFYESRSFSYIAGKWKSSILYNDGESVLLLKKKL